MNRPARERARQVLVHQKQNSVSLALTFNGRFDPGIQFTETGKISDIDPRKYASTYQNRCIPTKAKLWRLIHGSSRPRGRLRLVPGLCREHTARRTPNFGNPIREFGH